MSLRMSVNNYLSFGGVPSAGNTVNLNLKLTSSTSSPPIYSVSSVHIGLAEITNVLYLSSDAGIDFFGTTVFNFTDFYRITWTWDGTTDKIYVNGVLDITTSAITSARTQTLVARVDIFGAVDPIDFDGIKIWQATLSAEEIRNELHSIKPKRWQNLWAWLPCNNRATIGADYSGNERSFTQNGTITESAASSLAWGDSPVFVPQAATLAPILIYYRSPLMLSAC